MRRFDWSKAMQHFVMFTSLDFRVKMFHKMNPKKKQSSEYQMAKSHIIKHMLTYFELT